MARRFVSCVVAAVAVIGIAGCSSSGSSSTTASVDIAKDTSMKVALRNLANCEEAFFTDNSTYAAVTLLTTTCPAVKPEPGGVVTIHLAGATGYCLAGQVSAGRFWIYDSVHGGLRGPATSDTCDASTFTKVGGTINGG